MVKIEDRYALFSTVALAIVALDQLLKWVIYSHDMDHRFLLFAIERVENTGAAFGILKGYSLLLVVLSVIVIAMIVYYMKDAPDRMYDIPFALIVGGALGNLIDRIAFGAVRDFITVFSWFPTFNVADSAISIGTLALLALYILQKSDCKKTEGKKRRRLRT